MNRRNLRLAATAVLLGTLMGLLPASAASDLPRIYGDFGKLADLTDEQTIRIARIQSEAKEKIKQIEEEAYEEIMALLTKDQRAEIHRIEQERLEKRREYARKYRERKKRERERMKAELERLRAKVDQKKEAEESNEAREAEVSEDEDAPEKSE